MAPIPEETILRRTKANKPHQQNGTAVHERCVIASATLGPRRLGAPTGSVFDQQPYASYAIYSKNRTLATNK